MVIKDRLREYLTLKNLSVREFERKCGLGNGVASRLGNTTSPSTLNKISTSCDLNVDWLLTGEGEMLREAALAAVPKVSYTDGVPYYDVDFECGFDELINLGAPNPDYMIRMPGYEKATLWCNATGHSMAPEVNNGDIIALRRVEDTSFLPYGEIYAIVTTNNLRTVKRLGRSDKPGHLRLIPTNKDYDEQDIPLSKILHIYRVMGAMKAF